MRIGEFSQFESTITVDFFIEKSFDRLIFIRKSLTIDLLKNLFKFIEITKIHKKKFTY